MPPKIWLVLIAVSFGVGRFTVPEKVKIETRTVEVEKKVEAKKTDRDTHKETMVVEVVKPDGSKETTTKTTEDTSTDRRVTVTVDDSKSTDQKKEVVRGDSKVTISAMGGIKLTSLTTPPVLGVSVTKPFFGPITIGLFGFTDSTLGVSVGIVF